MNYHDYYQQDDYDKKLRHGFVTVFLIIGIVLNSIAVLLALLGKDLIRKTSEQEIPEYMFYLLALCALIKITAIILILKWKKIGFWLFALGAAGTFCFDMYFSFDGVKSILGLLGIGALFAVLQIRKFGKSTWESLD
ncbi:MAG: hypothetical protein IAF38_11775 [Bacteroidia bacterium]|nr:hypothetical protein [Bacteroidia bacterium]